MTMLLISYIAGMVGWLLLPFWAIRSGKYHVAQDSDGVTFLVTLVFWPLVLVWTTYQHLLELYSDKCRRAMWGD